MAHVLPLLLLGLQTVSREEFAASPMELAYGENLRLPSDPVFDLRSSLNSTGVYLLFKDAMSRVKPPPSTTHAKNVVSVARDFESYTHFLVRIDDDAFRRPLQPPFDGPGKVLERGLHHFTLDVGGGPKRVSISRLKSCFRQTITTGGKRERGVRVRLAELKELHLGFLLKPTVSDGGRALWKPL